MFTDDIKIGLTNEFQNDTAFTDTVKVVFAYPYGKKRTAHEVVITLLDDSTSAQHETFFGETIRIMPIQISVYSSQMVINGKTCNARESTNYLAEIVRTYMNKAMFQLSEIKMCRRTNISNTIPLEDSGVDTYFKALRYQIQAQPI